MAYLYGVSIQGIQGFIFETNRLKEIVGASNLIEKFTSEDFMQEFLDNKGITDNGYTILRNAGGNIRISFKENQKNILEVFVKYFPKYIMQKAYGITISQAVKEYGDTEYLNATQSLEILLKDTRNKVPLALDAKFALMKQAPRTGKPHYKNVSIEETIGHYDKGSFQKYDNAIKANKDLLLEKMGINEGEHKIFPSMLTQISNSKNKIAVIHADGNKMGLLLQKMAEKLHKEEDKKIQDVFIEFSTGIEEATKEAIRDAFKEVEDSYFELTKYNNTNNQVPFRPIVIGGDDVTVICHADIAIDFIGLYMDKFQENTKTNLSSIVNTYGLDEFKEGLTVCAGIAYCNEKFPFHYAVDLAEVLCGRAKNISDREDSCLLFHNIQGAAFVKYDDYVKNELTIKTTRLDYGPYYIRDNGKKPYLVDFKNLYKAMTKQSFPLGKLREWLSELHYFDEYAKGYLERVKVMAERNSKKDELRHLNHMLKKLGDFSLDKLIDENNKTPIHDILQLKSVQGGKDV